MKDNDGSEIRFFNTCPVDAWACILKIALLKNTALTEEKSFTDDTKTILNLIKIDDYNAVKDKIASMYELEKKRDITNNSSFDFHKSEYEMFLKKNIAV